MARKREMVSNGNGAVLGFEEKLWKAADGLRGHVEPAEYKHVVLSMLFLKYVADNATDCSKSAGISKDRFVVPEAARWNTLLRAGHSQDTGESVKAAISAIEAANPSLNGLLAFDVDRLNENQLAQLVAILSQVELTPTARTSKDILGRVYEYFLSKFASSEGRSGGEYYTPRSVVQVLVEVLRPYSGVVYDPCCGTAGMFVQSEEFIERHGGRAGDVSVAGQESSPTTRRLAKMNLALRGIRGDLGSRHGDTLHNDLHPALQADFILANPPFNAKNWGASRLRGDPRWAFGPPPDSNANFAWVQHIFSHLKPYGVAGFVLSNGSLSSNQSGEGQIRRNMIERDVIECVVALPNQLFYGTQIPACLWFISPTKTRDGAEHLFGRTLMIDARNLGHLVDRVHAELSIEEVSLIAKVYHDWRSGSPRFHDIPGLAKSVDMAEIRAHKFAIVPGRYVGFRANQMPQFDRASLAAELSELRDLVGEIDVASKRTIQMLECLASG